MAYIGKRPQDTFPAGNAVTATTIAANAVTASEIAINAVDTSAIADGAVTNAKLAANSIAATNIPDGLITGTQMANSAIGSDQIVNSSVTTAKLNTDAVTGAKIADDAIDSEHLVDGSIDTAHIGDLQVTSAKIAANTIATGNIADNAVDGTKIAQNSILTRHIDDDQITADHLADNAVGAAALNISGNGTAGQALLSDGDGSFSYGAGGKTDEEVQDLVGAMFSSNTETGISATYEDSDGTIDLVVGTLNQDTTGSAATLTTARAIAVSGAVTGTANFDGSAGISISTTLANNAVLTQHIDDNQITTDQIAENTIATANIADNAVDGTKIASNSILTRHIDDDQITGDQLADAIEVVTSVGVGGGSTNGVVIEQGAIKIKNGGTQSYIDLYCETSNAHYLRLQAPAHGSFSGNPTVTFPATAGTIALTTDVQTTEELQDLVGAMFSSNTETGITATYQDSDGTIDLVVGTLNQDTTGTAATVTTAAQPNITSVGTLTGLTVSGNTTVGGNLTVNGTTTTLNTTNSVISDRLIELGNGTSGSPANDMGIVMERGDSANAFMGFDESTDKFIVGTGTFTGASTGDLTITTGTLVATLEGNVTGNVTGNLTGTASAIADNSVTSAKIVNGTIVAADIANNAILTQHIDDNQVTADQIANATITTTQIAANTIATGNVADNAIDGTKIAQNSILTRHIDDAQVTTDQLGADAVTAAKLADDAVVTANIVDANVTTAKIADNAITAAKLSIAGNGTSGQAILSDGDGTFSYGSSGKTTEEIQDIVGAMFSSNTETNITVTYQDSDGTVDLVVPNELSSVTALGTLTTLTVDDIRINGTQIGHTSDTDAISIASNGIVTFTQIPVLPNDSITQAFIADDAVGADQLAASAVVTASIVDDNVTQAKIADDAVGADQLAANSVVSASIVNGSIVSADIAANTIATSNIADNAIDGTKIASNSILTRHVDDNQITGDQISDNVVLSGTGSVTLPKGTTAQRSGSAQAGMFRYNTTTGGFEGYTDAWGSIGGSGANGFLTDIFDGTTTPATDGSRVAFTMSQAVSDEKFVMVFIDGVYQAHDAYSVSGSTLTMADAPVSGRVLTVHSISATVSGDGLTVNNFSGDGSDTTFTLGINPVHENNTQVYIDGVYQFKNTYSISGTTLTFSAAPPNGTAIEVMIHSQTAINTFPATGISGLTEVTAVGADHFMIFDATDSALKKALVSDVLDNVVLTDEQAQDIVGAMFSSNTETGITATYQDADGTVDLVLDAAQPTVTSLGTLTALTVDNITVDGSTISGSGDITLDAAGDIILDADGDDIKIAEGGTTVMEIKHESSGIDFLLSTSDEDYKFKGSDGGSTITALQLDMSDAGAAIFNDKVSIGATGTAALSVGSSNGDADYESGYTVIEVGGSGNLTAGNASNEEFFLAGNAYYNSGWKYSNAGGAGMVDIQNGRIRMRTAADGSDGGAISFTTALDIAQTTGDIAIASSARITQGALTSSSNAVAWDAKAIANAYHVTTENTTFSAPSNAVEGAVISVELAQGGTARTIAWNTVFEFAASTAPTVTATANKTDIFTFRYNGSVWQEIGRVQNMAQT